MAKSPMNDPNDRSPEETAEMLDQGADQEPQDADEGADDVPPDKPKKTKKGREKQGPPLDGLTLGSLVHFVLHGGHKEGEHRAAIVSHIHDAVKGVINCHVFLNGDLEYPHAAHPGDRMLVRHVPYDPEGKKPKSWHWIERI